jgi:N-acetylglucosamine-6-sulfatase
LGSGVTRRQVVISSLLAGMLGRDRTGGAAEPLPAQAATRPNIVFIIADDLDLHSLDAMPRIPRLLGDQGVTFSRAYVASPSCCPSRASIFRGQYPHNHGVLGNTYPNGGFQKFYERGNETSTVATWLQDAGYRTALVGKYLNNFPLRDDPSHIPPGWDEWNVYVGEGKYFSWVLSEQGKWVEYGNEPADYETDVLARKATAFIEESTASGEPFFLYLAPHPPHDPSIAAPRHEGMFPDAQAPRTPAFNEEDVSDKPKRVRKLPPLTPDQIDEIDERYRARLRSMLSVDELVQTVIETLERAGALENTYIVFTSDNGYDHGEHRQTLGKGTPYEEATHVPLLVRGPGVPAGRIEERLVTNIDIAPTFAALAGAEAPDFVDGRSLVPLLHGEEENWRQAVLGQFTTQFHLLVTADRAYIAYSNDKEERELYDLSTDPYELDNLISSPDRRGEVATFEAWLAALSTCAAGECRTIEDEPPGQLGAISPASIHETAAY